MTESRLQRWARRKAEAGKQAEQSPSPAVESEPAPEEQELAINEALPEHELLEKYGLPDPDAIELGTDVTGFMRKEIPDFLRRKALRALWKSNPVLAVLDGLNDYDEDFTDAGATIKGAKTLYKVGQGLIDRTKKVQGQIEDLAEDRAGIPEQVTPPEVAENREMNRLPETDAASGQAEPVVVRHHEPEPKQSDEDHAPRFRPRMRFDY
ncbi:hypothetical protein CLH62_09070 [Marinobacter guineae]|uniref:DUF3306 domain-containing protein n=1 Tax=Marinobacter guineae TaxID=432303 RepID=A0A2G1VG72_9GAMM|nr:DUF3306 domain-containing protein [Marinobacter guineae]PHQ25746.1 hypothetical protein CLH62_09070 [Marinobacter guineae]